MSSNDRHTARARSPWSIGARLALWYTAATFVLVAIATGLLYWVLVTNVDREDDQFLVDTVQIMRALIRERPNDVAALRQEVDWEGTARRYAHVFVRVLNEDGTLIIETPGATAIIARHPLLPADGSTEPGPGIDTTSPAGAPYRMLAAWAPLGAEGRERRLIQIALDRTTERQLLAEYRSRLWAVLAVALMASAFVGYTIARRGMAPVEAIAGTARRIGSSTLNARIPVERLPGELSSLATTFNDMLDRLEDAFARLSSLSADLAHELRTPINNLRGEIEVALGKPRAAAEYQDTLASVLEESSRLSQMIDGLMFLARAENPETQINRTRVDVRRELRGVCEFYEPAAAEAGVTLDAVDDVETVPATFDRTLVQRALGNLILNAVTHTPSGGRVRLSATRAHGAVRIEVADTGAGIPAEHLSRVSGRFYRVDASRSSSSGGLGLGLAIVGSIMKVHGGSMEIASSPGSGTTVTLIFPERPEVDIGTPAVSAAMSA
jgi:two-component system, OmpR family, heavy metal sensor histidine kinase CusS